MHWSDEANAIVDELLRELPAPERDPVRDAATLRAETRTSEDGEEEVAMETAVRAFIEATPADLRNRLKHALTYHGIDPEEYEEAFSS
ncbi:MAG TPA: DUF2621 family protein [Terriglobales bacterium]|nr:DUF2621 family protein [Terriglobales bacterium]